MISSLQCTGIVHLFLDKNAAHVGVVVTASDGPFVCCFHWGQNRCEHISCSLSLSKVAFSETRTQGRVALFTSNGSLNQTLWLLQAICVSGTSSESLHVQIVFLGVNWGWKRSQNKEEETWAEKDWCQAWVSHLSSENWRFETNLYCFRYSAEIWSPICEFEIMIWKSTWLFRSSRFYLEL